MDDFLEMKAIWLENAIPFGDFDDEAAYQQAEEQGYTREEMDKAMEEWQNQCG